MPHPIPAPTMAQFLGVTRELPEDSPSHPTDERVHTAFLSVYIPSKAVASGLDPMVPIFFPLTSNESLPPPVPNAIFVPCMQENQLKK